MITPANLPAIVETLLTSIKDEHHIAEKVGCTEPFSSTNGMLAGHHAPGVVCVRSHDRSHRMAQVCYALSQLAAGFKDSEAASPLSPYFKDIIQALLETVQPCTMRTLARSSCLSSCSDNTQCSCAAGAWSRRF